MSDIKAECKYCAKYYGDCGNHFKDADRHIHYDIAFAAAYNPGSDVPSCFRPSDKYKKLRKEEAVATLIDGYDVDVIEKALEIAKGGAK